MKRKGVRPRSIPRGKEDVEDCGIRRLSKEDINYSKWGTVTENIG